MADTPKLEANQFEANFRKLEQLATDLEKDNIKIDELIPRAKEGAEAARQCQAVLTKCEEALIEIDRVYGAILADNQGVGEKSR